MLAMRGKEYDLQEVLLAADIVTMPHLSLSTTKLLQRLIDGTYAHAHSAGKLAWHKQYNNDADAASHGHIDMDDQRCKPASTLCTSSTVWLKQVALA